MAGTCCDISFQIGKPRLSMTDFAIRREVQGTSKRAETVAGGEGVSASTCAQGCFVGRMREERGKGVQGTSTCKPRGLDRHFSSLLVL